MVVFYSPKNILHNKNNYLGRHFLKDKKYISQENIPTSDATNSREQKQRESFIGNCTKIIKRAKIEHFYPMLNYMVALCFC